MSILIYRGLDGQDRKIQNPTKADWSECCRVVCEHNKTAIEHEVLRGMEDSLLLASIEGQHS